MQTKVLQINRKKIFWIIAIIVTTLVFLYVFLINMIAFVISDQQKLSEIISEKQSEIHNLETQYIADSRKINKGMAADFGLTKSIADEAIVVVVNNSNRLTLND